ncbi:cupredoxin family copper-binding protein [Dyella sp.]|uniref:cupredoxin domain-containing protein n=1 Tax=Dyella sp. TaxID=1869338 RepID=UPI002FDA2ED9
MRKTVRKFLMLLLMLTLSGAALPGMAAGTSSSQGKHTEVTIEKFAFQPKELSVPVGTKVVWTNKDEEPHTVTSPGEQFKSSKALDGGDTYSVTFSKPGTYTYFCTVHPFMTGTITVK